MAIDKIDYSKCVACNKCYDICPMDVFGLIGDVVYLAYPEDCARCFLCKRVCPRDAIEVNALKVRDVPLPY